MLLPVTLIIVMVVSNYTLIQQGYQVRMKFTTENISYATLKRSTYVYTKYTPEKVSSVQPLTIDTYIYTF